MITALIAFIAGIAATTAALWTYLRHRDRELDAEWQDVENKRTAALAEVAAAQHRLAIARRETEERQATTVTPLTHREAPAGKHRHDLTNAFGSQGQRAVGANTAVLDSNQVRAILYADAEV